MKIVGVDFETTGLDPKADRIIECGAVLYDWDTKMPLQLLSDFVLPERPIPEEITKLTGITDELVDANGASEREVLTDFTCMLLSADYVMAHFGNDFDRLFFKEACIRLGWDVPEGQWIDSANDIKYPESIKTRNLRHLAAEHNFLNSFSHRAVFDVLTMLKVASNYNIEEIIARSKEPTLYVQAVVSFDEKEFAKERGYRWCAAKKIWWKQLKQSDYEAEKFEYPFRTQLLAEAPE